jgi:siderophore synthetase component
MYRVIFITIFAAVTLSAQNAASIASLRQGTEQKTQAWETLANALENKIRGLLPCDPKIAASVAEVNRASDARLTAFSDYFRAVLAETSARAAEASRLLDAQAKTGTQFLETEHAEGVEERAGIEYQISQLMANPGRKSEIGDAETACDLWWP